MVNTKFRIITLFSMAMIMAGFSTSTFMAMPSFAQTTNPVAPPPKVQQEELKTPVLLDGQETPALLNGQKSPVLLDGQKNRVLLNPVLLNPTQNPVISAPNKSPVLLNGQKTLVQQSPVQQAPAYQYQAPVVIVTTPTYPTTPAAQPGPLRAAFVSPRAKSRKDSFKRGANVAYFFGKDRHFAYAGDGNYRAWSIKSRWAGIPDNIDAIFTSSRNKKAYFFKGSKYYRFNFKQNKTDNDSLSISRFWKGVPNNIDAVVEHPNGKVYFFKGDTYYRYDYDKKMVDETAKISRGWPGLPNNIDAALRKVTLRDTAGKMYFFKGDKSYRFNIRENKVDNEALISESTWEGLDFTQKIYVRRKPLKKETRVKGGKVTQTLRRNATTKSATISARIEETGKENDKGRTCTTQRRKFSDAKIDHFLKASNSTLEMPGNIIDGNDLFSGKYKTQNVGKNKYRLFITPSLPGKPNFVDINNPGNQSEVSRAIDNLRNWHLPKKARPPKNAVLNISAIESATEAKLSIGGSFNSPYVDVNTLFKFDSKSKTKKYLAEYAATYYTIKLEKLDNNPITKPNVDMNSNWVYVSEVKYGKRFLFALDTNESERASSTAVNVKGSYGVYKAEADLKSAESTTREVTSIKQVVQGGAIKNLSGKFPDNIMKILSKDKFSKSDPGAAVASVLRFVDNDNIAQVSTTADYTEIVCFRTSNVFKVTLNDIYALSQDDGPGDSSSEIFGNISIYAKDVNDKNYTPKINYQKTHEQDCFLNEVWCVEAEPKSMSDGTRLSINKSLIFKIPYEELQNAKLFIHTNLFEYDTFGNDVLGKSTLTIPLLKVTEEITVGGYKDAKVLGQRPTDPVLSSTDGQFYISVTIEPIVE